MYLLIINEPVLIEKRIYYKIRNVVVVAMNEDKDLPFCIKRVYDTLPDENKLIIDILIQKNKKFSQINKIEEFDVDEIQYYEIESIKINSQNNSNPNYSH